MFTTRKIFFLGTTPDTHIILIDRISTVKQTNKDGTE